ncbi:Hypothetical predicted protein [Olea europaea subsp. europaea]|uniref:Uncharacterized protein n=1 Tax=Olea europaea subsp. europaea TaxID=158383 RepID=A0A8S0QWE0_OLEEU|nr:Hypothetical predicted protein [Olea europaea subsp. europaea]
MRLPLSSQLARSDILVSPRGKPSFNRVGVLERNMHSNCTLVQAIVFMSLVGSQSVLILKSWMNVLLIMEVITGLKILFPGTLACASFNFPSPNHE